MLAVTLCAVAFFSAVALLIGICNVCEWMEDYCRWKIRQSIGHLNYSPKRYATKHNYCRPARF